MNNLQPNERHLADKLRQAPLPDVNRGWEQMRELLDREKPEAVVGGWAGNKRWWWMGITAALIMVAVWLTQQLNERGQKGVVVNTETAGAKKSTKTASEKSTNNPSYPSNNNTASNTSTTQENRNAIDNLKIVDEVNNSSLPQTEIKPEQLIPSKTHYVWSEKNRKSSIKRNTASDYQPASDVFNYESATTNANARQANITISLIDENNAAPAPPFTNAVTAASDATAVSGKTDKAYLKQLRKMVEKDNRRMSRSGMSGRFGDDGREITFAAGITIPQPFALGQQQSSAYSVNGKISRFMDYLPAPFFQYHINNKLFLQTEFHFQSPQYTNRLLLATSATQPSTNVRLEKNVYLEKLYYFNIPFNLYYTPARNFSIGSGLQYSNLLSGVASFEERRVDGQTTSNYTSTTRRFKDDSVAAKFAPSEWRYQFDANYYVKRFTIGLRYNQALKDFVNLQVNPALPATQDRNKSFLLYLRYNIWEERKKD